MTTQPRQAVSTAPPITRKNRWIENWQPEDVAFWDRTGAKIARRNLIFSILTEHIGFSVWSLWSVFVLFLTPSYGISHDLKTAAAEKFLLTTLPTAVGALLRFPYTLAVARFGGRNWTVISACLLLIPTVTAAVLLTPGVSYGTLLIIAALAGVGGGNFASSMANINSFYPQRLKGRALGLNAGGGNIGVAAVQLIGLAVLATAGKGHPRVMLGIYIPLVVITAACAALFMDNIAHVRNDKGGMRVACKDPHTWIISLLYIGTFGSFIGFSFAFGQVLTDQFAPHFLSHGTVDAAKVVGITFLGPLIGSLIRPLGGWLADRLGGAVTTLWNFLAMAVAAGLVLVASMDKSLPMFYIGFIALFALSGLGNGSTYKMIPATFSAKAALAVAAGQDKDAAEQHSRRLANAAIGVAAGVGAFGGVLVNIAFRQSFLASGTGNGAYIGFIAFYLAAMALTWVVYLRPAPGRLAGV